MKSRIESILVEAWFPVALLALWWFASSRSTSLYFPPLQVILSRFQELWLSGHFSVHLVPSLQNLALGLVLGLFAALIAGVALGLIPPLAYAMNPLLEFMRSTPVLALLPLVIAFFGIGTLSKVVLVAVGAFWPTFLNTVDGVRAVDPLVREMGRAFSLRRSTLIKRVVLPSASPQIIVGVRTSVSIAVVVMVGSELYGATAGIGYFVLQSQRMYAIDDMWAGLLLLGVLGYLLNLLTGVVERVTLGWHRALHKVPSESTPVLEGKAS